MKEIEFWGKNLEHCLEHAKNELNLPKDKLNYKIISNKTSLFKKTFNIVVYIEAGSNDDTYNDIEKNTIKETKNNGEMGKTVSNTNWGTAKVEKGSLIISEGKNSGQEATIVKGTGVTLHVDEVEVAQKAKVTPGSKVEIIFENKVAKREANIKVSEDKLSASLQITYSPEIIYGLEDAKEDKSIVLNAVIIKEEYPPKYTKDNIITMLKEKGIVYGLVEENIEKVIEDTKGTDILIAKGKAVEAAVHDSVKIYFKQYDKHEYEIDDNGNMDFKSIGNVTGVKKGDILCERIEGKEGVSGKNIFGQAIEAKKRKIKDLIPKEGCEFKDKNTIIASIDGRPQAKGLTFSVHIIHEVFSDVDIKTGNIHFIGDVIVHGDVKEGMEIQSGNSVNINSNFYRSVLKANGDVNIRGNVITSSIVAGGSYVEYIKYVNSLDTLADLLKYIYGSVGMIKHKAKMMQGVSDSDIIRTVITNKFKNFRSDLNNTLKYIRIFGSTDDKVFRILHDKFTDIYFSNIKDFEELKIVEGLIREKHAEVSVSEDSKSSATFSYIQDSSIECSGDIFITGKGVYKSYVTAMDSIYFTGNENSIVRGGVLKALNQIRAKVIGSTAGVGTIVSVSKEGHIYSDLAHHNTKLIVGERELVLDESYRNVHCYLNEDLEIVLDKFNL
ncbi:FapA family protein [Clostridium sp.]|uniref:DUF342 domain-containing protein n=1 Tax=Clostridium sp. TaxID=1506 RepID=UPI002FC891B1